MRLGGSESVPTQSPGNRIQHRSLSLSISATDNGQAVGCRLDFDGLHTLHIFDFQFIDFDIIHDVSS